MEEQKTTIRLLFVGSPLLDISGDCDDGVLCRFKLKEDDCVRAGPEHEPLFQRLFVSDVSRMAAGGSAQNAARVAKWTLGPRGEVAFAGCAGDDTFEAWMRENLQTEGVHPIYFRIPGEKTGVCACLLSPGGKRSMCTRHGAAAKFSVRHLHDPNFKTWLDKADCVSVVGYFLVHSPEAVAELAELCRPEQVFSLSLSAEYVCRSSSKALLRVLPRVDVLFGNEAEVKACAVVASGACHDVTVTEALQILRQLPRLPNCPPRIVVVTQGSKPLLLDDGSDDIKTLDVAKNVTVADGVGCGDALCGAFLTAYIRDGRDAESAAKEGIRAATRILQVHGCDTTAAGAVKD
ncbi:hypothetical protein JTE90_011385 [Oedothorax gibbosus]|uniref:Adenosine kinase n=1 Tax=Oedothorax gibbosus TaxID=931172 RepID=A0AAV6VLY4_9ARAC|nr:hypothetical protein JTE90_011385 [Oedothorax gibbosus]